MSRWPRAPLGAVCEINPKQNGADRLTPAAEVSFVPMAAVDETSGHIATKETRPLDSVTKGYTPFRNDDVLFAKITPCMENGKAAIARELTNGVGFGSTEFHVLRSKPGLLPEWVFAFIRQPAFRDLARANFAGTAGQQRVPADFLKQIQIPLPPFPEQERIVRILDNAEVLCRLRAQADQRTASLVPALFREMFGSPAINPFGWPVESVGALYDDSRDGVKCGPFGSALKKHEYIDSGIPVWGIPNVLPNQFVETGSLYISRSKFEELRAYMVEPGDLLISRAGTVGRICVARPRAADSIIGTNLIRLTLDRKRVVPEFFSALMTHFAIEVGRLHADTNEGSYSFMNTTVLQSLQIYVPPLKLQESFAACVAEIHELEAVQVASRKRLDDLFQSLLHRAFEGEL